MAIRPIFVPRAGGSTLVDEIEIEFKWFPGFSVSQKHQSINSLHDGARRSSLDRVLEVSTKAPDPLGARYSAFKLKVAHDDCDFIPLECAFQGSKVFANGGPFTDLYFGTPIEAKKDPRLKISGKLEGFDYEGDFWGLLPRTAFYDFLYLNSLKNGNNLLHSLQEYDGFSDIEFNPKKSINCQARSCALAVALELRGDLDLILSSKELFLEYL
nr:hypothetical protein [Candidatus Brocadiales bacterium]